MSGGASNSQLPTLVCKIHSIVNSMTSILLSLLDVSIPTLTYLAESKLFPT